MEGTGAGTGADAGAGAGTGTGESVGAGAKKENFPEYPVCEELFSNEIDFLSFPNTQLRIPALRVSRRPRQLVLMDG